MKRFGRTKSVVTEGNYTPSGQSESSVGCVGETTLLSQSTAQHPQPLSAAGAGRPTGDVGGASTQSPASAKDSGAGKRKAVSKGRV